MLLLVDQTQVIRWDTVFYICRPFITFSATSAYLYSWSKELQFKWQARYYCWMWWTMWGCSCLQLGAVQEPYLVGINNWSGMCMDHCIVHRQRQGLRLGACMCWCRCTGTVWHRLQVKNRVLCANVFIGKGSCRVEDWMLCANVFIGIGSCRVGDWVPVCTDALLGIGCRIEDWYLKDP